MLKVKIDDVLKYEQPTKYIVETENYSNDFKTPVLTAGKSFILGYTDEENGIYKDVPVIIFDDFTTAFHYVDFPFKVKSSAMKILNVVKEKADLKYLFYRMQTISIDKDLHKRYWISKYSQIQIPLPPLTTQQKIAKILDTADQLRQYNKQLIEKYDALTQSLFLDMFGDPIKNEKGWEKKKLGDLGVFKNGLNYSKSSNGKMVKILGVGDFKDYWKISNYDNLSTIEIETFPSKDFLLKNGDLIFVRSNGNKDLVGRCLIAYPNEEKVTYSGFCIRFRKNISSLSEMYLVQLMRNKLFKKYIFKNGRGANIQNINQELLSNIEIQLPPIDVQNQFAERVQMIETQKQQALEALAKSEVLFQSLLQRAFNWELN
jgi:type I restriction enzyme S subunit